MIRSLLYVPGGLPRSMAAALSCGADCVIVDLHHASGSTHDAVRSPGADSTRQAVASWLTTVEPGPEIWVRVNPGPQGHADVRAAVRPGLRGVCVARTESTTQLAALDAVLSTVETEAGLPARSLAVTPLLSSAVAVLAAPAIARAPRVVRMQLDEARLCAELGVTLGEEERELLWVRSQIVLASAAAGIGAPIAPAHTDVTDLDRFRASTLAFARLGFRGRACIHPGQVAIANEVFASDKVFATS